jgi:hypothetical protein
VLTGEPDAAVLIKRLLWCCTVAGLASCVLRVASTQLELMLIILPPERSRTKAAEHLSQLLAVKDQRVLDRLAQLANVHSGLTEVRPIGGGPACPSNYPPGMVWHQLQWLCGEGFMCCWWAVCKGPNIQAHMLLI